MKNEKIDGIGTLWGGEYDSLQIDGIGKLRGDATAQTIHIDGIFKGKGQLNAQDITIGGLARQFRDVRGKRVHVHGFLKLRGASLRGDEIHCDGGLVCNREINADVINIEGPCSIRHLYGDQIQIKKPRQVLKQGRLPRILSVFTRLYYGRKFSEKKAFIDTIECTHLEASRICSQVVRAQSVKLRDGCHIRTLHCDGPIDYDETCEIKNIVRAGKKTKPTANLQIQEEKIMNPSKIENVLELLVQAKISAKEAGQMIRALQDRPQQSDNASSPLPWPDDDRLRVVVYRGTTLLQQGDADALKTTVEIHGSIENVECAGNLQCQNVDHSVKAGGNVECDRIDGNLTCGGNVRCRKIDGNVKAGGGVRLEA